MAPNLHIITVTYFRYQNRPIQNGYHIIYHNSRILNIKSLNFDTPHFVISIWIQIWIWIQSVLLVTWRHYVISIWIQIWIWIQSVLLDTWRHYIEGTSIWSVNLHGVWRHSTLCHIHLKSVHRLKPVFMMLYAHWPLKAKELKSTWKEQGTLVLAYNCTRNNVTDFSPYYLMFGWKPHLPFDILFGMNTADLKGNTSTKYVENLKWRIEWSYKTTNEVVKKEQEWNKWHYDCKVRCIQLKVGDKVLLKCTAFKGKHKIQDRLENTIYEVVEQTFGKIPVLRLNELKVMIKWKWCI